MTDVRLKPTHLNRLTWIHKTTSFALVGGGVFVLGTALLYLLVDVCYWQKWVANAFQLLVTLYINYQLNRRFTWRSQGGHRIAKRFVVARLATVLLSFALFNLCVGLGINYLVANVIGVGIGTAVNYVVADRWVFSYMAKHRPSELDKLRLNWRTAVVIIGSLILACGALWVDARSLFVTLLLVALSTIALATAILFLVSMSYTSRAEGTTKELLLRQPTGPYKETIAIIMPARHEGEMYAYTLLTAWLTQRAHPSYRLLPTICYSDPDTIRVALAASRIVNKFQLSKKVRIDSSHWAVLRQLLGIQLQRVQLNGQPLTSDELDEIDNMRRCDHKMQILVYPLPDGQNPSKPLQLNHAFQTFGEEFSLYTILDAESLAAESLLTYVDQAFQDHPDADIIQGGVQLMDPIRKGSWLQRLRQYGQRWYSWHNLLEYYRWFSSQMKFQSDHNFVPLGGNTVFIRSKMLTKTGGWPLTLTEDCALGVEATAVHGAKVYTFYSPHLVTREETPPTLRELIKQRTRWTQGFLQTLLGGHWRVLPTLRQQALALWILSMPFFQALSATLVPLTVLTMFAVKSPPPFVLIMYVPIAAASLGAILQLKQMHEFAGAYDRKVAWHVYVFVLLTQLPYQMVLSWAALLAVSRHLSGRVDWHRTARSGEHLQTVVSVEPVALGETA